MTDMLFIKIRRVSLIFILLFSTVGCDQLTKVVARDAISQAGPLHYLNSTVVLEHAENPGAFLSLGANLPSKVRSIVFTGFVTFFLLGLSVYLFMNPLGLLGTVALTVILAGGLANLIDRASRGTVTDFIILRSEHFSTGIFNIADMAIVLGGVLLLFMNYHQVDGVEIKRQSL